MVPPEIASLNTTLAEFFHKLNDANLPKLKVAKWMLELKSEYPDLYPSDWTNADVLNMLNKGEVPSYV